MKVKTNRLIASGLFSILFIGELYLILSVINQFGTTNVAIGHLLVIGGVLLLPVFAVLIANPCFEHRAVKSAVLYSGVLYACACALLFSSGSMLYATGLQSETQTVGYYVVAAKVVLVVVALVIAAFEPKGVEMLNDCAEETAAEISDDEAGKMGL
ncbi:hypothetical protein H8S23_12520 [Anaerofilum sp. BX8]|uniref:Uncharacterized protein n=1 Tax=Anaerofilum hominis TaxID=2763016 RepID=A0A923L1V9_9FIRM|nr:hypothetical protein [Anaerofilum hominis]MBC5582329.1 hypothetical protein [Anaerofilum hominis]